MNTNGVRRSSDGVATHQTPLLSSEAGSLAQADEDPALGVPGKFDRPIGPIRAVVIILSSWLFIFLQASNMSGMTMTQSAIAEDLHIYDDVMWLTSAYLIATSSLAPVAGRLATIFSPRSLVLPIGCFFATGGLVTSQAHSFSILVLGRILTGIGGAGIMTLALVLVLELTSPRRRGLFIGLVNAGFTIGLSFGAVVYGAALPFTGWRLLFAIQAPLALLAALGVFLSIPKTFSANAASKDRSIASKVLGIDYGGALLLCGTIVLFLYSLSGQIKWHLLLISLLGVVLFVAYEFRVAGDPIIPLKVLSSRGVLLSCAAQLGFMSARWTLLFYSPIFVLSVKGFSPVAAGSILIPTNLGFGSGGLLVGWLHVRRGGSFWLPCLVTLCWFAVTLFGLSIVGTPSSPVWMFIFDVVLNGLATGAALNYTLAHLLHVSHHDTQFITTSLLGTFRGFGGSFGTAIGGGVFYRVLHAFLTNGFKRIDGDGQLTPIRAELVKRLLGSPALVFHGSLTEEEHTIAMEGYASACRATWRAAAGLAVVVILLQAATGSKRPLEEDKDVGAADQSP